MLSGMPKQALQERDPYLVTLGEQIRHMRLMSGWTQDEFAALTGLHRTHPSKLEKGLIDPRLSTLRRIARVFGVAVRVLLPTDLAGDDHV